MAIELYGRKTIYSDAGQITRDNVVDVLNKAVMVHTVNAAAEKYLYDYYKGKTEIRNKEKTTRPEINHKINVSRATQIVDFKTGYLVGEPIVYTTRNSDTLTSGTLSKLNIMMMLENKASEDKRLVDWMHITGHGYRMVLPAKERDSETAFHLYTLCPMNTFVIYSTNIAHEPIAGVYYTSDEYGIDRVYSVYTRDTFFEIKDGKITREEPHYLGAIPIVEYPLNEAKLGSFECVISLLDSINYLESDRMDGVTQFVNSLVVLYNAQLPEGETGNTIRDQGLIALQSYGENKADIKIISEQLDQTQTQALMDDLYHSVLTIVGMPTQSEGNTSDSSNNGAMFLKQGYQLAEARAKDEELMFKGSERKMLSIALAICKGVSGVKINLSDVEIMFTRRNYEDIVSKVTVLSTLLGTDKVAPYDAWQLSGITPDPEEAYKRGIAWYQQVMQQEMSIEAASGEMVKVNPAPAAGQGQGQPGSGSKSANSGDGGGHWVEGYYRHAETT